MSLEAAEQSPRHIHWSRLEFYPAPGKERIAKGKPLPPEVVFLLFI